MKTRDEDRVAERLREIERHSPKIAGLFRRVYHGPAQRASAVKAKCLDCCCYQYAEVYACGSVACPLWRVRPRSAKARLANPVRKTTAGFKPGWKGGPRATKSVTHAGLASKPESPEVAP
jgi:hypothetical protein